MDPVMPDALHAEVLRLVELLRVMSGPSGWRGLPAAAEDERDAVTADSAGG